MPSDRTGELERSLAETDRLMSACAHDLQEPLRKIVSFGELLERRAAEKLDPTSLRFLGRMIEGSRRMSRLIDDLQRYSKLGDGSRQIEKVELSETARDVLETLHSAVVANAADVELGPLPAVRADAAQARLLLLQIISNALKFRSAARPPRVKIWAVERADGFAAISVSDNGIGFDARDAAGLFEPFRRLNPRSDYDGSALGLACCRKIARLHGGDVWVRSSPDVGSTFTATLPLWGPS